METVRLYAVETAKTVAIVAIAVLISGVSHAIAGDVDWRVMDALNGALAATIVCRWWLSKGD